MIRYLEKVIVPFVNEKRAELKLPMSYPALAIFYCFKGQTTPAVKADRQYHTRFVFIPPNCTEKLQPLDISIDKPIKSEMKKRFQLQYAEEVQKKLKESPIESVKVDVSGSAVKHKSANWLISHLFFYTLIMFKIFL